MQDTWVHSLSQEDALEKEMATHSSIPAWEMPRTEEPGGLYCPRGLQRVGHDWAARQQQPPPTLKPLQQRTHTLVSKGKTLLDTFPSLPPKPLWGIAMLVWHHTVWPYPSELSSKRCFGGRYLLIWCSDHTGTIRKATFQDTAPLPVLTLDKHCRISVTWKWGKMKLKEPQAIRVEEVRVAVPLA